MDRLSSTILQPLFASKDALLVQHEDPSHGAQAEDEKPRYYPASTHTLCIHFPPAFAYGLSMSRLFLPAFFVLPFFVPAFFAPPREELRRGSPYYLLCPALSHT